MSSLKIEDIKDDYVSRKTLWELANNLLDRVIKTEGYQEMADGVDQVIDLIEIVPGVEMNEK